MKGLETLIKLQKRELDRVRKEQVQLEEKREQLLALAAKLHNEVMEERRLAAENPIMAGYMGDYEKRMQKRQLDIAKETIGLDQRLAQLAMAIAEAFGELKKYEITRDNRREQAKSAADRREQGQMDELGLQQFVRKDNG